MDVLWWKKLNELSKKTVGEMGSQNNRDWQGSLEVFIQHSGQSRLSYEIRSNSSELYTASCCKLPNAEIALAHRLPLPLVDCSHSSYLNACSLSFFFLPHTAVSCLDVSSWSPPHGPRRPRFRPPKSFPFSRTKKSRPLSFYPVGHVPQSLTILVCLHWIFPAPPMSFLYQGLKLDTGL